MGKIGKKRGFCTNLGGVAGVRLRGVVCSAMVRGVVWQRCSKGAPSAWHNSVVCFGVALWQGVLDCVLLHKFLAYNFLVLQSLL